MSMRQRRPRRGIKLAVEHLGHVVLGNTNQIVVRGAFLQRLGGHRTSLTPRALGESTSNLGSRRGFDGIISRDRTSNEVHAMKRLTAVTPILIAAALLAAPTSAHHSQSMFDTTKEIVIEGTVSRFDWVNPHMYL